MDGGWTAFGTSAQVAHGNSGGPVLDRQGRVLGVVSFAISTDPQGEALGEGFFVPADVIRETLDKAAVKPATGTLTGLYYQALSQGDFRHYRHELAILSQVQTRSAWHAYVKDAVSTTQSAVLSGKDQTPPELGGLVPAGLGALAVAAVLALGTVLGLRLRRTRRLKAAAAAAATAAAAADAGELTASPDGVAKETVPIA
jgi:S1-C subfamily serine protease